MKKLQEYYDKYKNAITAVSFYHWLEGEVTSILEFATENNFTSVEELRKECKKLSKK